MVSDGGGAPGGGDDGDVLMLMVNMARGDQSLTSHNYHHPHPSPLVRIETPSPYKPLEYLVLVFIVGLIVS